MGETCAPVPPSARALASPSVLLGAVCALSVGARVFHLDIPAEHIPGQGFVFDEKYYVNAARVIAGVPPAAVDTYAHSPAGTDPNGEHPQLGKLIIAATIRLFGDNPIGWRIGAVLFGTLALLLLYRLVRDLGGSPRLAVAVTALGAIENLWLVSGRIAVLDIYCIPFMLAGVILYLRRHPVLAGVVLGMGLCVKEFAVYALIALLLFEAMRGVRRLVARTAVWEQGRPWWRQLILRRLAMPLVLSGVTVAVFFNLLALLDATVPPYHNGQLVSIGQAAVCDHVWIWKGACNHAAFMNSYAAALRSPGGPQGIAAYPWQFWGDVQPINYFGTTSSVTENGTVTAVNQIVLFLGLINPVVLVTSWLAILLTLWWAVRRRDDASFFTIAWIIGTWLPAELFSLLDQRTTYLYYMVMTMPALFIAVARLLAVRVIPRWLVGVWVGVLLTSFTILYPFRTLTGT